MRLLMAVVMLSIVAMLPACTERNTREAGAPTAFETRSSEGDISFRLTPNPWTSGHLIIDVRADTHSGDLAEMDLRQVVVLHVGAEAYRPGEATPLAGHHAEGSMTFDVPNAPERFAVTIAGVRSMNELRFEWP